jgi:hypothetical protein
MTEATEGAGRAGARYASPVEPYQADWDEPHTRDRLG